MDCPKGLKEGETRMTRVNATSEAAEQGPANERPRVLGTDAIARVRSTVSASQFNLNSAREPLRGSLSVPLGLP